MLRCAISAGHRASGQNGVQLGRALSPGGGGCCGLRGAVTPVGSTRLGVGVALVCGVSDMSPYGATRSRRTEASAVRVDCRPRLQSYGVRVVPFLKPRTALSGSPRRATCRILRVPPESRYELMLSEPREWWWWIRHAGVGVGLTVVRVISDMPGRGPVSVTADRGFRLLWPWRDEAYGVVGTADHGTDDTCRCVFQS